MQQHIKDPQRPLITWVLIADMKQAQIYNCSKTLKQTPLTGANPHHYYDEKSGHALAPVLNGLFKAESIDDYQVGHDRRGTASSSNSSAHNTYEPKGDIKTELKRRFAETLSDKLQQAYAEKLFDQLVLVAPPKMIGEFREQLTPDIQHNIVASLSKDLMHYHGQELMTHLHDTLMSIFHQE
jgi:protein required for attachment to host cells